MISAVRGRFDARVAAIKSEQHGWRDCGDDRAEYAKNSAWLVSLHSVPTAPAARVPMKIAKKPDRHRGGAES